MSCSHRCYRFVDRMARCRTLQPFDFCAFSFRIVCFFMCNFDGAQQVKRLQREWLGRRDGAIVKFRVLSSSSSSSSSTDDGSCHFRSMCQCESRCILRDATCDHRKTCCRCLRHGPRRSTASRSSRSRYHRRHRCHPLSSSWFFHTYKIVCSDVIARSRHILSSTSCRNRYTQTTFFV